MIWRGIGFVLIIATSSGLATLHFHVAAMRETAGGILGQLVGHGLEYGLGLLGATVLMLVLWLASVSLATGVSWLAVMDHIGRIVYRGARGCTHSIGDARIWWKAAARSSSAERS